MYLKYSILFVFCISSLILRGQNEELTIEDYGFQIKQLSLAKLAPYGYEAVHTVELTNPLYAGKAYEVGFWIFGKQLTDRSYSFPINVFPSNFMGRVDEMVFELVESVDIMPSLQVSPPPSYTSKGHFKFIIRPDTLYSQITIVLKNRDWGQGSIINFNEDITVTGVFVKPLKEQRNKEMTVVEIEKSVSLNEETIPEKIAERILIDSKKSYSVSEQNISIGLYDHRNIDKDRVTIYLNNKIVVENLELKRKKKIFNIKLKPGKNLIALHAENLGEVAPNTAAILIKSKSKEYEAVLASDLGQSQYFTLIYETKN